MRGGLGYNAEALQPIRHSRVPAPICLNPVNTARSIVFGPGQSFLSSAGRDESIHFVNAVGQVVGRPPIEFATAMPKGAYPGQMNEAWVAKFGVNGHPAPNTVYSQRPWLDVRKVCGPNGLNIPVLESYPHANEGVIAGDMCPFCAEFARSQGFSYNWFLHQNDDNFSANPVVKPEGFANQYLHQVRKCARAVAMIHVACRLANDKGLPSKTWMFESVGVPLKPGN